VTGPDAAPGQDSAECPHCRRGLPPKKRRLSFGAGAPILDFCSVECSETYLALRFRTEVEDVAWRIGPESISGA
jgi:hypothetical protein